MTKRNGRAALAPIVYASLLGDYSMMIMPFIVGGMLAGYGLSPAIASRGIALQFFVMAASSILTPALLEIVPPRLYLALSAFCVIAANLACATGHDVSLLLAARGVAGFGEGALMAVSGALAAGTARPERSYTLIGFAVACAAAFALVTTPRLANALGPRAIFFLMAALPVLLLPMLAVAPRQAPRGALTARNIFTAPIAAVCIPGAGRALLGYLFLSSGGAGLWVFAERIGETSGFTNAELGLYLAIGQICGVVGPMLFAALAPRLGFVGCFAAASALNVVSAFAFALPPNALIFSMSSCALSITVMFLTPCFRTLMVCLDPSGRVVALSVAMFALGCSLTPMIVGLVVGKDSSLWPTAVIGAMAYGLSFLIVYRPARATRMPSSPNALLGVAPDATIPAL